MYLSMPEVRSQEHGRYEAQDLRPANLLAPHYVERTVIEPDSGPGFHVSVSIGAAAFPAAGSSLEEVLISADNALFAAKDAGRNQVRVVKSTA